MYFILCIKLEIKNHICCSFIFILVSFSPDSNTKFPSYQAYSSSGHLRCCSFVYLNYGRLIDFIDFDRAHDRDFLNEPSILCNSNLIAIIRLGKGSRVAKIKSLLRYCKETSNNLEHPCAVIFYPDPEDVIVPGEKVYPFGPGLPGDAPVYGHVNQKGSGGGDPCCLSFPSTG